ncbi:ABC transporter family substrate-binding protein [Brachybacterium saurashtrense]|uniref:ABC transporter family substrate-binding protein n=1 Tax=Brachybacterium saurashtrense TaxID=556288 RepID=A0A345YKH7_9MICO|nr:ABC transporter family substrate-binding protein [Brachybacterium saurashtrense]AXK44429.1 ABC transporter family substrate-binding protein [Brachybacterium saurashtrense]RRR23041.1 ABC transporter family substrate-binding protein [Brachybacterium saurashtrense]
MKITSTRRLFLAGTGVVGSAAALAACGGQQSEEEQQSQAAQENEEAAEATSELPSTDWERMDYDDVPDGGTLRKAILTFPANWNRSQVDGNNADTTEIAEPCGAGAEIIVSETGEKELNPDYIESAEMTSEDPQTVVVKYNPDAVWDDGSPIVVADLIAQWEALNGSDEDFLVVSTVGWDQIESITQTDDEYSAEIVFSSPYIDWITVLHPEAPASVFEDAENFNSGYADGPTPGKGPFTVGNLDQSGGVVTLERNEHWWGRAPKLESIIFQVVDQTTQPQSFANGEIDWLDVGTGDVLSQAKTRSDANIQTTNGLTWTHLTMNVNGGDGVLEDVAVREAIARAIDRDAIGRAVVGPLEAPIVLVNNFVYMPGQDGYQDSYEPMGSLTFDPEAAGALLDEAGWVLEGETRSKDGKSLDLSVIIPADTKSNSDRARQVQTNLNAVGFNCELQTVPSDGYFPDYVMPGSFDMVTFSWVGTPYPESSSANLVYPLESGQNFTGYADDRIGPVNEQLKGAFDIDERHQLANELSTIVAETWTVIPFYATPNIVAIKQGVVNTGASQFESTDWTQVGISA